MSIDITIDNGLMMSHLDEGKSIALRSSRESETFSTKAAGTRPRALCKQLGKRTVWQQKNVAEGYQRRPSRPAGEGMRVSPYRSRDWTIETPPQPRAKSSSIPRQRSRILVEVTSKTFTITRPKKSIQMRTKVIPSPAPLLSQQAPGCRIRSRTERSPLCPRKTPMNPCAQVLSRLS